MISCVSDAHVTLTLITMGMESGMPRHEEPKLGEDVKKALDMSPAPAGKIEGDLGELDQEMEAKAVAQEQAPDFDATPAPDGKIGDKGLAKLDRMLQVKKADEQGIHEVKRQLGIEDDTDQEKAA